MLLSWCLFHVTDVRPVPLSTMVRRKAGVSAVTRATLIRTVMEKTLEVNHKLEPEDREPPTILDYEQSKKDQ